MPPSVSTGTEEELGRDDYLQPLSPHSQLHSSYPDFASLQCPHVSTLKPLISRPLNSGLPLYSRQICLDQLFPLDKKPH